MEDARRLALVAGPSLGPGDGQGVIPGDAFNIEVAPSDISPGALYRRGDSVAIVAAVPPGASNQKQIVFGYALPAGLRTLTVAIDQPIARLQVLIEDQAAELLATFASGTRAERTIGAR